jgi:hypothetical protein
MRATCALVATVATIVAQTSWQPIVQLSSRWQSACVYDAAHGNAVLFGGNDGALKGDTWTWDGSEWTLRSPATQPAPRRGHTMTYDSLRQRVLLFGGYAPNASPQLWSWDGADWSQIVTAVTPTMQNAERMVYDALRDRVVLYTGQPAVDANLWEFDGVDWTHVPTAQPNWPQWNSNVMITYDATAGNVALYLPGSPARMWRWDGSVWTTQNANSVFGLSLAEMVHDSVGQRLLLVGGSVVTTGAPTLYAWDAGNGAWQPLSNGGPVTWAHTACFDSMRDRVVLVGGSTQESNLDSSVWEWDGGQWLRESHAPPAARSGAAVATDPVHDRVILYGGESINRSMADTWVREQGAWSLVVPHPSISTQGHPGVLRGPGLVYDSARDEVLLFGGTTGVFRVYRLAGTQWQTITPTNVPPGRERTAAVYDSLRQRVILFGGSSNSQTFGDTWAWDGTTWTELTPSISPSPRESPGLAYDELRDRVVLHGGGFSAWQNDTWEFDGALGDRCNTTSPLPGTLSPPLAYDRVRQVTVAQRVQSTPLQLETWQWDGSGWSRLGTSIPSTRTAASLVATANDVLMIGGRIGPDYASDHLSLATSSIATLEEFGVEGISSAGPLRLRGTGALPWAGTTCRLACGPLPGLPLPALSVGLSRTSWMGSSLPMSLAVAGYPNSTLYISPDAPWPVVNNGIGTMKADVPLPFGTWILGVELFFQAAVYEPLSGLLATSNGLHMTIGSRN